MITTNTHLNIYEDDDITKGIRIERGESECGGGGWAITFFLDNRDAGIIWYNAVLHNLLTYLLHVHKRKLIYSPTDTSPYNCAPFIVNKSW